jgi:hypothetical protein
MAKVAIVVLAGTETREGLGRVVNALERRSKSTASAARQCGSPGLATTPAHRERGTGDAARPPTLQRGRRLPRGERE